MKLGAAAIAALLLGGCGSRAELPAGPGPLDPLAFFSGSSSGAGTLDTLVDRPVPVTVASIGRRRGAILVLDQRIRQGDLPPRMRRWTMRQAGPGRYTGQLTDADGPVEIVTTGPRARIAYRMKNGMAVDQQLALQPDGRTLLNRMSVSRFGIRLATLDETIRKRG